MAPTAEAFSGVLIDVEHNIVVLRFAGHADGVVSRRDIVESELVPQLPGDVVVCACKIAGNAETAHQGPVLIV
jgi:hypothetical protein